MGEGGGGGTGSERVNGGTPSICTGCKTRGGGGGGGTGSERVNGGTPSICTGCKTRGRGGGEEGLEVKGLMEEHHLYARDARRVGGGGGEEGLEVKGLMEEHHLYAGDARRGAGDESVNAGTPYACRNGRAGSGWGGGGEGWQ